MKITGAPPLYRLRVYVADPDGVRGQGLTIRLIDSDDTTTIPGTSITRTGGTSTSNIGLNGGETIVYDAVSGDVTVAVSVGSSGAVNAVMSGIFIHDATISPQE